MVRSLKSQQLTDTRYQIEHFFSPKHFDYLKQMMSSIEVPAGSHLFWEGDPADQFYFILHGQIKISKSTEQGKELLLYILQQGDFFGEFGGLEEPTFTFHAESMVHSTVGVIKQKDLENLISSYGDFALEFMKWMGLLQKTTESKFRDLLLFGKSGALASTLIRLTNSYGEETEEGIRITLKLTNTDLADMIGATRENVNRLLHRYMDDKVISLDHGVMTILNLQYLRDICECADCPANICRI